MRKTYTLGFVLIVVAAMIAQAQVGRPVAAAGGGRWQYAETYLLHDTNGNLKWTIAFPEGRLVRGTNVGDVARQLNIQNAQEGLLGMYNLMGTMGWEFVGHQKETEGVSSGTALFKRPS
jgi:hypothetical protein